MFVMPFPGNFPSSDPKTFYGERVPDTTHTGSNDLEKSVFPDICCYVFGRCLMQGAPATSQKFEGSIEARSTQRVSKVRG